MADRKHTAFTPFSTPPTVMRVLAGLVSMRLFGRHGFTTADSNRLWWAAVIQRRKWAKEYIADHGREMSYTARQLLLRCPPPAVTWDTGALPCAHRCCPFCHARNVMRVFNLFRDGLPDQDVVLATWRPRFVNLWSDARSLESFLTPLQQEIVPWVAKLRPQLIRRWRDKELTGATFVELGGAFKPQRGEQAMTWQPRLKAVLLVPRGRPYKLVAKTVRGSEEHRLLPSIAVKRLAFELGYYLAYPRTAWQWSTTLHHAMTKALYRKCTNTVFGTYQAGTLVNEEFDDAESQDFAGPVCEGDFNEWRDAGGDRSSGPE